ncbi:unnamed protein product [Leptosia nina]|uniref:BTB domain-containing protein n=1 Tax=Leptosia nina TaxID=320188 RepID=A0AAV1IXV7_9NEOP
MYTNLSWSSHHEKIRQGFTSLLEKELYVDMTFCADGYLVKAHKNIVALVSPYLREMINSTAAHQHPIIFLNGISHGILTYILEYIYTGESHVPNDVLPSFLKTAEELHLCGLSTKSPDIKPNVKQSSECSNPITLMDFSTTQAPNVTAVEDELSNNNTKEIVDEIETISCLPNISKSAEQVEFDTDIHNEQEIICNKKDNSNVVASYSLSGDYKPQQYSVSSRGSLQLILNRFIYNLHHQSNGGRKKRWRCVDYRRNHCPVYIDTIDENIVTRKNPHSHPFHDEKILKKVEENKVYGSVPIIERENNISNENNIIH